MSTTTIKRPWRQALADAEAFRNLFPAACYERWEIAGSTRRQAHEVGDVEHVVIPRVGEIPDTSSLFGGTQRVNLLWHQLDAMVEGHQVDKHVYSATDTGAPLYRWGDRYRGVDFRGFNHELFVADADNWGSVLTIRTGPAEFSQAMVTRLRRLGRRNYEGYVRRCQPCPGRGQDRVNMKCERCQGTNLEPIGIIPTQTERSYFEACDMTWIEPEDRR